ncbi:MAG TPA: hypothetical protein VJX69_05615 [Terriglobales bacterium]|nr:hypothetical protein [Terriglobales bacterium]
MSCFLNGVGHEYNHHGLNHADDLPSAFAVFDVVVPGNSERIMEDLHGVRKPDAVLAPITVCFIVVPLEKDHVAIV